jgi:YbgC/YbaW family acyl-CoA thioester hydrolase
MPSYFDHARVVEFAETDLAGIVHFANYLRYMESAEHAFMRSLGFSVHGEHEGVLYGWPRVHVSCDYRQPLRFEDRLRVRLVVRAVHAKALECVHLIYRQDGEQETLVAVGQMTNVCVRHDRATGQFKATAIPAALASQLQAAPPELYQPLLPRR